MHWAQTNQIEDLTPTRKTLLGRLRDREDQDSWQDFFDTYWRLIYNAAIRTGLTDAEAQDVVQETVIEVSKTIDGFEHRGRPGSFRNWLLRLAGWRITDRLRSRQRQERIIPPRELKARPSSDTATIEQVPDPACVDVAQALDEEWELNLLHIAIQRVRLKTDAKQYQIFDLCVFQEWPVKKVARTLGVRPDAVYVAKHRVSQAIEMEVARLQTAHAGDIRNA